jgi:hypothetical protein
MLMAIPGGRYAALAVALTGAVVLGAAVGSAQSAPPAAKPPVLLTSCGQSPGPQQMLFFLRRLGVEHELAERATAQNLVDRQRAGNPVRTLIVVTGASLKGMGAAGTSMRDELTRTSALLTEAKRQGVTVICAHVEGMARRAQGATTGDNSDEQSIDAVCPKADLMIVRQDGNADRRFSIISEGQKVPLVLFEKNMELSDVLKRVIQD